MSLIRPALDAVDVADVTVASLVRIRVPGYESTGYGLVAEPELPAVLIDCFSATIKADVVSIPYVRLDRCQADRTSLFTHFASSARTTDYAARAVQAGYPMADVAKAAVESGTTLPATPYWERVRTALADTWSPVRDVSVSGTPAASQRAVRDAVAGRLR